MKYSLFLVLILLTPRAYSDLVDETLANAGLNMSYDELRESMNKGELRIGDSSRAKATAERNKNLRIARIDDGDIFTLTIDFADTDDGVRTRNIVYNQSYKSRVIDVKEYEESVIAKYGRPYFTSGSTGPRVLRFADFSGVVPNGREVIAKCQAELVESGRQPIEALARGEASSAVSSGAWMNHGTSKAEESCPDTVADFERDLEFVMAPRLEVKFNTSSAVRTLSWEGPSMKYKREVAVERQHKLDARPKVELD